MNVRFRFKSTKLAEDVAAKLPVSCDWKILHDQTSDAYLEVIEEYEEYIERNLYTPYYLQK